MPLQVADSTCAFAVAWRRPSATLASDFLLLLLIYYSSHVKFLDRFLPGSCRKFFFEFLRILFISGPGIWWFLAYNLFTIILIFIFKKCKRLFSQVVKVEKHDPGQCLIEISMRHLKRLSRDSQETLKRFSRDISRDSQEILKRHLKRISRDSQENLIEISKRSQWDVSMIFLKKYLISRGSDYRFGSGQGCGIDKDVV